MIRTCLVLALMLPTTAVAQGPPPHLHTLMPVPASLEFRPGRLAIDSAFAVAIPGYRDDRLDRAVERAMVRLARQTGISLTSRPGRESAGAQLVIQADGPGQAVQTPDEDESYTLEVTADRASLHAPTVVGVIRGLETLLQLVDGDDGGFFLPGVVIADRPRFPWRGLLIDVGRHFEPVEVIQRNLDAMAAVKLNVFHWHLSDDQGFRVESRKYPLLQRLGSDGLYYTQDQIRGIVAYARDRGIRVVPEFDMPGHSSSWFVGYPQYASAPGPYAIERRFGVFDPTFDPTRDEVYGFIDGFIGEMAQLFPDPYWHVGGDEVTGRPWRASPRIQQFMRQHSLADPDALQGYFNQRLLGILTRHGKRMVGWDEILHPGLPQNAVIQSWRGAASMAKAARDGYNTILSSGFYLDHLRPAEFHYAVDPLPADAGLSEAEAAHVLGGEACMWAEHVWQETIDSRIWPRLAAIAERLWSPREVNDVDDMYRRLAAMSVRLEALGLTHRTSGDRLLRRLAGGGDIVPLQVLLQAAVPVFFWRRGSIQKTTQLTPLTRLVDAARPDSPLRRELTRMAGAWLASGPGYEAGREQLAGLFASWSDAAAAIDALAATEPLVRDAEPAAGTLARLGQTGLQAMTYLEHGTPPPAEWVTAAKALLEAADKPLGLLRVEVGPGIRLLVEAAAELGT